MSGRVKKMLEQAESNRNESSISFAEESFADEAESAQIFSLLKTGLLRINQWNECAMLSEYELFDENGWISQNGELFVGVFIRIALKGSGKYDWIRVIGISEAADEFIITVQPTYNPTAEIVDKTIVSHFFTREATNNFCLVKKREKISLYVIGLNEKRNTEETENVLETIRNAAVNFGSYFGVQKGEWTKFCQHFLEKAAAKNLK